MSRNLGMTWCKFCDGRIVLEESPRPLTREEAPHDYDKHRYSGGEYGKEGAIVANAHCFDCEARYIAYVDFSACPGFGQHAYYQKRKDVEFFDLSFRSTFNDEPGPEDLPRHVIEIVRVRKPWPTCSRCGLRIHMGYGCQCEREMTR